MSCQAFRMLCLRPANSLRQRPPETRGISALGRFQAVGLGPPPIRVLTLLIQLPICPTLDESAEQPLEEPAISPHLHLGIVPLAATAPPSPRDIALRVATSL